MGGLYINESDHTKINQKHKSLAEETAVLEGPPTQGPAEGAAESIEVWREKGATNRGEVHPGQ